MKTVDDYIKSAPRDVQTKLLELRKIIKSVAPRALEKLSYGMPYYGYKGRFAYFAFAKKHVGLYITPPVIAEHRKELKNYSTSTATIRFPLDEKLPVALIKKMLKSRLKKNEARSDKQKTCGRGHEFSGSGPCQKCWPGRKKST